MIWLEIKGTKDRITSDYAYIAIYRGVTREGSGVFWIFRAGIKARVQRNALSVGSLPTSFVLAQRVQKEQVKKSKKD